LALIAFLCWCAVKQSINQSVTSCIVDCMGRGEMSCDDVLIVEYWRWYSTAHGCSVRSHGCCQSTTAGQCNLSYFYFTYQWPSVGDIQFDCWSLTLLAAFVACISGSLDHWFGITRLLLTTVDIQVDLLSACLLRLCLSVCMSVCVCVWCCIDIVVHCLIGVPWISFCYRPKWRQCMYKYFPRDARDVPGTPVSVVSTARLTVRPTSYRTGLVATPGVVHWRRSVCLRGSLVNGCLICISKTVMDGLIVKGVTCIRPNTLQYRERRAKWFRCW